MINYLCYTLDHTVHCETFPKNVLFWSHQQTNAKYIEFIMAKEKSKYSNVCITFFFK